MRYFALVLSSAFLGCGKPPTTEQPEPVPVNRKFFDDANDPAKNRPVPKPASK